MRRFRDLPISRKLAVLSATLVACVVLASGTLFILFAAREYHASTARRVLALAGVIESNCHAAVSFEDARRATESLAALAVEPEIDGACIYTAAGRVLASFPSAGPEHCGERRVLDRAAVSFARPGVEVAQPIVLEGEVIGLVTIHRGFGDFLAYLVTQASIAAAVMALGIAVSVALVVPLHRVFTDPIRRLLAIAGRAADGHYTERATKHGNDELGLLTDAVNEMLDQIERRDAALEAHRAHLEATVTSRTAQLVAANEELRVEKERAEEATRLKSQFLANMSHEIRTPLNGVLGIVELLHATELSPRQRHLTDTARRSGQALLGVINDILDFSKIESGRLDLEHTDFDLLATVDEALEMVAEEAQRKGLRLARTVDPALRHAVRGDPARFRQVLVNLVANAVKFTHTGEVAVSIATEDEEPDGIRARVEVRDTGIGIAPEALPRLFDAFCQADGSTTRRFGGSGLGLAIVRQLCERMSGEIEVESVLGRGSTFRFSALLGRRLAGATSTAPLRGLRVLIVADGPASRASLEAALRATEATFASACSASSALESLLAAVARGEPYHAALVELGAGRVERERLAAAIHGDSRLDGVFVVLLGQPGAAGELATATPLTSGAGLTLTHPIRGAELRAALATARARARSRTGGAAAAHHDDLVFGGAKVLLVEDNATNREIAAWMLELLGCRPTVAHDGFEALAAVGRERFDLVLMDCQMPGLDGFEATARIRRREAESGPGEARGPGAAARLPIIALTAFAVAGDRQRCLDAGMDDYLAKPFTRATLSAILAHWLPRGAARRGANGDGAGRGLADARGDPGPTPPPTDHQPIDHAVLDQLRHLDRPGEPSAFERALATYRDSAAGYVDAIVGSARRGDSEALWRAAHSFKSPTGFLGATALVERLRDIEQLGRAGDLENARALVDDLADHVAAVCRVLGAELGC